MPDVTLSIIVVTYNAARFLPTTIDSLRRQDHSRETSDYEVLLIDGNSRDETVKLARDSRIFASIISEPDEGIYDAMNKGARLAKGEWIQFLNAGDTLTHETSLNDLVNQLGSAKAASWAICGARNMSHQPPRRIPSIPHRWLQHALGLQPHCHQATFFRRSVFLGIGGHSTAFGITGDFDIIMRFGLQTPPYVIDAVHIDYLGGGVSDGAWRRSAQNQHLIRVARFDMPKLIATADSCWTHIARAYNRSRVWVGMQRQRFTLGRR